MSEKSCDNCLTRKRMVRALRPPDAQVGFVGHLIDKFCSFCITGNAMPKGHDWWEKG